MKEILYMILVVLLTPIYIIIKALEVPPISWIIEFAEIMVEAIRKLIDDMAKFWKNILKRKR